MTTPIEEFIQLEKLAIRARAKKDLELWQKWNDGGKKEDDLEDLMKQMDPLIRKQTNVYAGKVNIPSSAIRAEFQIQAMKAFNTYDPKRGAQLNTHLNWQLKRGKRFITTYQNIGRIPETRAYKITEFQNTRDALSDRLGREPSAHELADKLKWPINQVTSMELDLRREVPTSALQADASSLKPSKEAEVIRLLQYDLTSQEKLVYEYLLGLNGKPQLKPGQISRKMNIPASKVSRIKNSIGKKASKYI